MPHTEFYCHSQLGCLYSLHNSRQCLPKYKYQTPKIMKTREREYYFISIIRINEEARSFPCRLCCDGQLFTSDIFILTCRTRNELPNCDLNTLVRAKCFNVNSACYKYPFTQFCTKDFRRFPWTTHESYQKTDATEVVTSAVFAVLSSLHQEVVPML
jgi:hypothetical protein